MSQLWSLVLPAALLPLALPSIGSSLLAASPWWEDYTSRDTYLCHDRDQVVLERNDSQAAITSGGQRTTLFRQSQDQPGLTYGNDLLRVILRGDELTLEQRPRQVRCLRMEQV